MQYIRKMGGIILVASIIIWALSYFPQRTAEDVPAPFMAASLTEMQAVGADSIPADIRTEMIVSEYQQQESVLGRIGRFCEPVVSPLGFDWKVSVSLIAGAAAKEIVVSTLGVLYVGGGDDDELLAKRLQTPSKITGETPFTPLKAMVFMIFVLLYFPCVASVTAIVKETGSWKYGAFSVLYNTGLAWLISFIVYRIGMMLY